MADECAVIGLSLDETKAIATKLFWLLWLTKLMIGNLKKLQPDGGLRYFGTIVREKGLRTYCHYKVLIRILVSVITVNCNRFIFRISLQYILKNLMSTLF